VWDLLTGDCYWVLKESKGGHVAGVSGEQLESAREDGQTVFQYVLLISEDSLSLNNIAQRFCSGWRLVQRPGQHFCRIMAV
jgi:hypothetical protein